MKRTLKWIAGFLLILLLAGFVAYLYFIPPLLHIPPEALSDADRNAAPSTDSIAEPRERLIAERGRHLVVTAGCSGCHTPPEDNGAPNRSRYLAGGVRISGRHFGTVYSRNLTPDPETGLGQYSVEEIVYRLRTGQMHDGRILVPRAMPWAAFSNWTDEDRYAIAVYLRHVRPVRSLIPAASPNHEVPDSSAVEAFANRDFSGH